MIEIHKPDASLKKLLPPVRLHHDIVYVPSQFALSFEHHGKRYVFNTLTKQCLETELPDSIKAGEGYDDLIAAQFLVPEDRDECEYYNSISSLMRAYRRKRNIRGYIILPTLGCNARCVYCYEEGRKQVVMTPETVEQTIRFILDQSRGDNVRLSWFGGEPLLGVSAIDRISEALREAGLEFRSRMTSNGSLITPEIVDKMTESWNLKKIQISMDGAESDYIARKRYYTYHDDYHAVMGAVDRMSDAGIAVTIRCNVDEGNWDGINRFLEDLSANVKHREKVSMYFSPLYNVRISEHALAFWEKLRDARPLIEAAGFRASSYVGIRMRFRVNHCMADAGSAVIGPDGSLYSCQHCPPESWFGDIWHGTTDEGARKEFCRMDRTREMCRTCPLLPDCTSFASCPWRDIQCREMHTMMAVDELRRMVDKKTALEAFDDGEEEDY